MVNHYPPLPPTYTSQIKVHTGDQRSVGRPVAEVSRVVPVVEARRPVPIAETGFLPIVPQRVVPSATVGYVAQPVARHFARRPVLQPVVLLPVA